MHPLRRAALVAILIILPTGAFAHVGSKDVFELVDAGPYQLYVTIRPPTVIPGVATVEIRTSGAAVTAIEITPVPLTGEASLHPPSADVTDRSPADPAFFTGKVWMMSTGSWQVRLAVDGAAGRQIASVPVPAVALSTLKMQKSISFGLGLLALFLVVSMAGLAAAAVREARLNPGLQPTPAQRRRGFVALATALALMVLILYGGATWWNVEAGTYAQNVYRPMQTEARLSGNVLDLLVQQVPADTLRRRPGRSNADFLPDHGHLIHLYLIRQPQMDAAFHLHPAMISPGDFRMTLPAMPAGDYALYGDVVHANGFPETLVAKLHVPDGLEQTSLAVEDAEAMPQPLTAGQLGTTYRLPDGYQMTWDRPATLVASTAYTFRFHLLNPTGQPAADMQPYLGMAGHAAFVKTDGTVFAHTHPEGSAPMQSVDLAVGPAAMRAMDAQDERVGPAVDFPYGFPTPGAYRIFVQMKHSETVETGVFDATVLSQ